MVTKIEEERKVELAIKAIGIVWIVVLAIQFQGYLSHRRKRLKTEDALEPAYCFTAQGEGEASFSS